MLKRPEGQLQCLNYVFTGNCLENGGCGRQHPDLRLQTKKKLQFSAKKEFVPNQSILGTLAQSQPQGLAPSPSQNPGSLFLKELKQPPGCECCKGFPQTCANSGMCVSLGKCTCVAHLAIEESISMQEAGAGFNCNCCKGNIYNCVEVLCQQLGMCQCQMHREMEEGGAMDATEGQESDQEYYLPEFADCPCCGGFVLSCGGPECYDGCFCLL